MATYKPFLGFVQFDPNEREVNGQDIRDVVIKPIGYAGDDVPNIRVTLWPEFKDVILGQGDLLAVDGKYTTPNIKGKVYHNLSATSVVVLPAAAKSTDGVDNPVEEDEEFDPGF